MIYGIYVFIIKEMRGVCIKIMYINLNKNCFFIALCSITHSCYTTTQEYFFDQLVVRHQGVREDRQAIPI